jgi:hypothetical protein
MVSRVFAFVLLLAFVTYCFGHGMHMNVYSINLNSKYNHRVQFDANYTLHWKLENNNKTISFAMDVKTTGWVGFGISQHGKMSPGSDIAICYVKDGRGHLSDRYSLLREEPKYDTTLGGTDDLKLVNAREHMGHTICEFTRAVHPEDRFDLPIKLEGKTNIIWAYSFTKPQSDQLRIHNRYGSTEMEFGEPSRDPPLPDRDVVKTPIQMHNLRLTNVHTQYSCKNFKLSELGINHETHAVKFEPIIDNAQVLHHIAVYQCRTNLNTSRPVYDCLDDMPQCSFAYIWAVGAKAFCKLMEFSF